ncbi:MAG: hypothetical protein FRX49_05478 [Trebouxia sp. A1-2]|nr:MAG: hypothetical protein FRX49_05478 [Trebouxia sp. A1-2]
MGTINIPANPAGPGHASVSLSLDATQIRSLSRLLQQAVHLVQTSPAEGGIARDSSASLAQDHEQYLERADQETQAVYKVGQSNPDLRYVQQEVQPLSSEIPHDPNSIQGSLATGSKGSSSDQVQPAARQRAWAIPQATDHKIQSSNQANVYAYSNAEQHSEGGGSGQGQYPQGYQVEPRSNLIPAQNSPQDWPTAQQAQTQPPGSNKTTYGSTTGSTQWVRPGGKNAGKQLMASRGFNAPIQITRVDWGVPLANAQDTWGADEPEPQPLPSAMPAAGVPSVRRPVRPTAAFPPLADNDSSADMSPTPAPQQTRPRAARPPPPAAMHWQRMWTTDALDHTGDDVRACLHIATMPDLVDESGAGWLTTASNNVLNLWGCTCIGSPGEPALQLVHSLDTEFQVSDLQIDPANSLLMAAARDTKALTECVALHHLRMSPGIFRLKGRLGLPAGLTGKLAKNTGSVKALQVQSVHCHQGVLAGCCAASHDRTVTVYPSNVTAGEVAKHKAVWKAHGRPITVLHANTFCPTLLSGDDAGSIYLWNMRSKPTNPEAGVKHEKAVTGIHSTGQRSFVSCSLDGRLCVWDFNVSRRPLYTVSAPDGSPINKMAVRKDSLVAFCTSSGLYVADVSQSSPVHTVAVNQAHEDPTLCLAWNTGSTGQTYLYANNGATISVYRASQYAVPSM